MRGNIPGPLHVFFALLAFVASNFAVAGTILSEDWESSDGTTIKNGLTISGSPLNNLGMWIDFNNPNYPTSGPPKRWNVASTGGNPSQYAQHLIPPDGDQTNILYRGIDIAVTTGMVFQLDFDFINQSRNWRVALLGLTAGSTSLDPSAPFWYDGDGNDGVNLLSISDEMQSTSRTWTSRSLQGVATGNYDALAVAFVMGGTTDFRGVDNIQVSVVPAPATLLLLGLGIAGIGYQRRKQVKTV